MLILVSGKNGSGKSVFAENLTAKLGKKRVYIATMKPYGEEGRQRVEKHRIQRKGLDFTTLELESSVRAAPIAKDGVVLLEDASNLLANTIFAHGGDEKKTLEDIYALNKRCKALVVVTISGLSIEGCDEETKEYIRGMESLNSAILELSDAAVEMQKGKPITRKGNLNEILQTCCDCSEYI